MVSEDFRQEMREIDVPCLMIHGDRDRPVPLEIAGKASADLLRNSRLLDLPGCPARPDVHAHGAAECRCAAAHPRHLCALRRPDAVTDVRCRAASCAPRDNGVPATASRGTACSICALSASSCLPIRMIVICVSGTQAGLSFTCSPRPSPLPGASFTDARGARLAQPSALFRPRAACRGVATVTHIHEIQRYASLGRRETRRIARPGSAGRTGGRCRGATEPTGSSRRSAGCRRRTIAALTPPRTRCILGSPGNMALRAASA